MIEAQTIILSIISRNHVNLVNHQMIFVMIVWVKWIIFNIYPERATDEVNLDKYNSSK